MRNLLLLLVGASSCAKTGTLEPDADISQSTLVAVGEVQFQDQDIHAETPQVLAVALTNHSSSADVTASISGNGFSITQNGCDGSLATDETCFVDVQFSPGIVGEYMGELEFSAPGVNSRTVALVGNGGAIVRTFISNVGSVSGDVECTNTMPDVSVICPELLSIESSVELSVFGPNFSNWTGDVCDGSGSTTCQFDLNTNQDLISGVQTFVSVHAMFSRGAQQ